MVIRFLTSKLMAVTLMVAVGACSAPASNSPGGNSRSTAELQLDRQAAALQKTLVEAVAVTTVASTLISGLAGDNDPLSTGLQIGVPAGLAAGSYVGFLQSRYITKEARLERALEDAQETNAETEAAIQTMRVVLAQQQKALSDIRASGAAQSSPELTAELADAQANLTSMNRAIDGAENRRDDLASTRSLNLTGIDPQIAELSARIQTMRQIAQSLSQEI